MAGVVPYALCIPSPERAWRSFWDSDNPHLLVPRSLGVGWRLNLAEVQARLDRLYRRLMGSGPTQSRSRSRMNSSARP